MPFSAFDIYNILISVPPFMFKKNKVIFTEVLGGFCEGLFMTRNRKINK